MPAWGTLRDVDARQPSPPFGNALLTTGRWSGRRIKQWTAAAQGVGFASIGPEAIVTEAHEADGQHVPEKSPHAGVGIERHRLDPITLATVTGGKTDRSVVHIDAAVVGDCHAVGSAPDVCQALCRAGEGLLGVHDPIVGTELIRARRKALGRAQGCAWAREGEGLVGAGLLERVEERAATDRAQGPPGAEDAWVGVAPALAVAGPRPGRDHAVEMAMPAAGRPTTWAYGLPGSLKQQGAHGPLVGQDKGVECVRQRANGVKIGDGEQVRLAGFHPRDLGACLTRGARAIAACRRGVALEPTVGAAFGRPSELRATTDRHIVHDVLMGRWHGMGCTVRVSREAEDVSHFPPRGVVVCSPCRQWAVRGNGVHDVTPQ